MRIYQGYEEYKTAFEELLRGNAVMCKPACRDLLWRIAREQGIRLAEDDVGWGVVEIKMQEEKEYGKRY